MALYMVLRKLRPAATTTQKEVTSFFMNVRHSQPSTGNILALHRQRRFYTNYCFSRSTHDSERPGIEAMEHWGADAAVFNYSRPGKKDLFLADELSLPELHFFNLQAKLEIIDVREGVASVSCTMEVINSGGADRFGACFILRDVIAVANERATDHLLWEALSEEGFRICVFRAEKSRTPNGCNDTTTSMYFLIRVTVSKDLMEQLAKLKGFGEVRCFMYLEPQGGVLWMGRSPPEKSE
ncbi:hypothetical protein KC332_g11229 [Hortaea werneckii]|nr:hypothetical protein KC358_g13986 [Hortaea werneckii]KAI6820506.1 hypothetical protein KC350_g9810 [Hortaea werneckii]KAI6917021.1 hypothetical protein KC348_g11305 [Hortaea werneckii]KAI6929563.1 hypothetical protein KC341_g10776 [Hortaea werneckii]KAI6955371.1 hypothetical protein KC321_g15796 [Hortaea werneckii]